MANRYVVVPADVQPFVVCKLPQAGSSAEWLLLPSEANRTIEGVEKRGREVYNPRIEFLTSLNAEADIGGKKKQHEERCERAVVMAELLLQGRNDLYRPFLPRDLHISLCRVYIGQLIAVQEEIRKRLQQRLTRLEREQEFFASLPAAEQSALDTRFSLVGLQGPIDALLQHEQELERAITRQLAQLEVFNSVLEPIRGMGPRISARILGAVVDISRFPTWRRFVKYCGWHTIPDPRSGRYIAARFTHGESGGFHERLRMGWWLFGQQINRNNSQFRWFADQYKAAHEHLLGPTIEERGHSFVLTKQWLNARAIRYAVSKATKYFYHGWRQIEDLPCEFKFPYTNWLEPEKYWAAVNPR